MSADRYPLRASHRIALVELIGTQGLQRVAAQVRTNVSDLDAIAAGTIPPTLSVRTAIIKALIGAKLTGRAVGDYSDPFGPGREGVERLGPERARRRLESTARQRRSDSQVEDVGPLCGRGGRY